MQKVFTSTRDLLAANGLDFAVEQWPLYATNGERRAVVESHVANVRSDSGATLGIVGSGYTVVQNSDVADFVDELLAQDSDLALDGCFGSLDGASMVIKLRGGDFGPKYKDGLQDMMRPQLIVTNGHDGNTPVKVIPSTLRLYCTNQLHLLSEAKKGVCSVTLRHTRNIAERVDSAKYVIAAYKRSLEYTRELIAQMGDTPADKALADRFFTDSYSRDYHPIPKATDELTRAEQKQREKAIIAYRAFEKRLAGETAKWGWNLWSILNAYTGYVQHDNPPRTKDAAKRAEQITQSNLFGLNIDRTMRAFSVAMALAV